MSLLRRFSSSQRASPKRGRTSQVWRALRKPYVYLPLNGNVTNYGSAVITPVLHGTSAGACRIGSCYNFGSATDADYIDLGFLTRMSAMGFCAWIYPTSFASGHARYIFNNISSFASAIADFPISFYINLDVVSGCGDLYLSLSKGDDYSADLALTIYGLTPGSVYFVGFSYQDYVKASIYCNGTYVEKYWNAAVSTSTRNYTIGRVAAPVGGGVNLSSFYGAIDECRMYNFLMTKEDFDTIYNFYD